MRRIGKTTRTIDAAIQTLFNEGYVIFPSKFELERDSSHYDRTGRIIRGCENKVLAIDYDSDKNPRVQKDLYESVMRRLKIEHSSVQLDYSPHKIIRLKQ